MAGWQACGLWCCFRWHGRFLVCGANVNSNKTRIYRGYYMVAARCEFCFRMAKTIFYEQAQRVRLLLCEKKLVQNMLTWSVAKHYGCKCTRHCGLIAKGCSQANHGFPCVRKMNCCSAHCALITKYQMINREWTWSPSIFCVSVQQVFMPAVQPLDWVISTTE